MSKFAVNDVLYITQKETGETLVVVVTQVIVVDGYNCYRLRRKDNKTFKTKTGHKYNIWYKGEKVEVLDGEKT
jgi:hypothetical protein